MNAKTNRRRIPLLDRIADRIGGWKTVDCPDPHCSMQIRFRDLRDAYLCQRLLDSHVHRAHAA